MSVLVVGAGGQVGSALVARLRRQGVVVEAVYSPWSGQATGPHAWTADARDAEGLRDLRQSATVSQIYYCASRPPSVQGDEARYEARVQGVATVCRVFKGVPVCYGSSRRAEADNRDDWYAMAQRRCEQHVTHHGGRSVRFPALYSAASRPWLRWVKWLYPAWSVDEAVTALIEEAAR